LTDPYFLPLFFAYFSYLEGDYHAHANYSIVVGGVIIATGNPLLNDFESEYFSPDDLLGINSVAIGRPGYQGFVGTPGGVFWGYSPSSGMLPYILAPSPP
jgi:hypothetical protein